MDNQITNLSPHPQFLDLLFAFKTNLSKVFREVIGLHRIDHIALASINRNNQLVSLSSTPAIEFNLFRNSLWRYDQTYNPNWFNSQSINTWQSLYYPARYDELYYLKQSQHAYPVGISLGQTIAERPFIYSFASHNTSGVQQEHFLNNADEIKQIGRFCALELYSVFCRCDPDYEENDLAISA